MSNNVYLENEVMTATQDKLLIMMYEGAINFLKRIDHIDFDKDIEVRNYNIKKAMAIIAELQCTLNMDHETISAPLYLIYDYMSNRLIEANVQKKKEYIDEVTGMLVDLKVTFQVASKHPDAISESQYEVNDQQMQTIYVDSKMVQTGFSFSG